jgi:DNA-binding NarL/FixJ family response regulator
MIPLVDPDLTKALAEIRGRAELLLVHLEPRSPLRDEAAAIMDAAAEAAALAPGGAPPQRPPTVLLAEDEDTVRRMLVTVLESAGFQVLAAANGHDALAAASAEPGPIDVLVTDVVMPAMDGVELAERLAADRPDTRVVFVSGYTQHPALEEGLRLGTIELLRKPFSIHDLIARVRALAAELRPRPVTCVVADDHPPILDAVARFLEADGLQVVATAANGPDALRALEEHRPDVALVDVRMPGFDGVELTRRAAAAGSETRVALYTGSADPDLLSEALAAGAAGFVLKHTPLAEVASAVRAVAAGGVYVDRELAAEVARVAESEPRAALTSREREVLALVAKGLTNDRIADQLRISAETVQTHVRNVMAKLHASTRTEAVASALRAALIG